MAGGVKFDGTITLGHILQAVVILGAVSAAYVSLRTTDENHDGRLKAVEQRLDRDSSVQQQILNTLATIREDIATLKERTK